MKKLIPLLLLMLMACEKEVNLNLSSGASRLVVDGQIESGGYPVVILTKSVGYFSTIDLETMESSFVHDALVRITDGIDTVTLREYSLDTGLLGASQFYLYTVDTGDFQALQFTGKTEGTYTLLIEHEGNIYSSSTKIPNVDPVDSIWVRPPAGEPVVPTAMMLLSVIKTRTPSATMSGTSPSAIMNYFCRVFTAFTAMNSSMGRLLTACLSQPATTEEEDQTSTRWVISSGAILLHSGGALSTRRSMTSTEALNTRSAPWATPLQLR